MRILALAAACSLALAGCATAPATSSGSKLTPGQDVPLVNATFTPDAQGRVPGWTALEHNVGQSYTFVSDTQYAISPPASVRIRRHGREFYGMLDQRVTIKPEWVNRTARLSGYLRTQGATGEGAALVLMARDGSDQILAVEMMNGRRVRGDQDWKQYEVQVKLPPRTYALQVGVMLQDDGAMWADDLKLELVD
jgi:hypothetical protein